MVTREEYIATPGLNFSKAKLLLKSPAHFKAAEEEEEKEPTEAQQIGTLAHAMVLEGKDLRSMYAIKPDGMTFASNAGKAWKAEQTLPILTQDQADMIPGIADAIARDPFASAALKGCVHRERMALGSLQGVWCKGLLDCAGSDGSKWAIGDFKTTVDASPRAFEKLAYKNDYDLQAVWYSDLIALEQGLEEPPFFFWIACEKAKPFVNAVYHPSEAMMDSGREKLTHVLDLYKRCQETGKWPGYTTGIVELNPPAWATTPAR